MDHVEPVCQHAGSVRASSFRRKTVLVVDDEPYFRELTACILSKAGYQVDGASDGSEAIRLAGEHQIDLLVMDIVMPNREGIETIQYFSKIVPKVPIVAVSGSRCYLRPARALGAVATLEKMDVASDLLSTVRSVIGE
jgi:CheY-like chemotaxis protein